jgi:Dolichyl-phosphate-mannose-protein mannosyltransferase
MGGALESARGSEPGIQLRGARRALALAVALYLVLRGLTLAADLDEVAIPVYELAMMGNIAHIAQGGWEGAPLTQFYDNCGGHLVTGLLAVPFYALLGDTYLALKLVPLLLGVLLIWLAWCIALRLGGPRAATWTALLLAVGPPILFKYSLLAKGNHFENLPFQLLAWLAWLRWMDVPSSRWRASAFGAAAGFALFFYFGSAILLATLAATHLAARGPRQSVRDGLLVLPGALIGLAPLAAIQLATAGRPAQFLTHNLALEESGVLQRSWSRASDLLLHLLPRAGCFEDLGPIPARAAELVFLACFVLAWCALALRAWRGLHARSGVRAASAKERIDPRLLAGPLVLYLPLWLVAYMLSGFTFRPADPPMQVLTYRYLVPHFMLALVAIGTAASLLPRRRGVALGGLAFATGLFTLPVIDWSFSRSDLAARYPGYHFPYYVQSVLLRDGVRDAATGQLTWDEHRIAAQVAQFSRREQSRIFEGLGCMLTRSRLGPAAGAAAALDLDLLAAPYGTQSKIDLARGAGSGLRELASARADRSEWLASVLRELQSRGDARVGYVAEGLSQGFRFPQALSVQADLATSAELGAGVPAELQGSWLRGRGIQCGRLLGRGVAHDVEVALRELETAPPTQRPELWFGVGWGLAEASSERAGEAVARWVPEELRSVAWQGIGAATRHLDGALDAAQVAERMGCASGPESAALARGLSWPSYPAAFTLDAGAN